MKDPGKTLKVSFCILILLFVCGIPGYAADYKEAHKLFQQGRYDEAIVQFQEIAEVSPEWYFAHLMLGRCYLKKGQISQGMVSLDRALEYADDLKPKFEIWFVKAEALYDQQKYSDVISATEAMREYAVSQQQKFVMYKLRGLANIGMGKKDEAIREFNQALNFNPSDFDVLFELGKADYEVGNMEPAISYLEQAMNQNPNVVSPYLFLLDGYIKTKQFAKATQIGERGMVKNPQSMGIRRRLGQAYLGTKNYSDAIQVFNTVLEVEPSNAYARYNRGQAYFATEDFGRAVNDFLEASNRLADKDYVFRWLGDAYMKAQETEEAIKAYEVAYNLNPSSKNKEKLDKVQKYKEEYEAEMKAREEAAQEEAEFIEEGGELVGASEEAEVEEAEQAEQKKE